MRWGDLLLGYLNGKDALFDAAFAARCKDGADESNSADSRAAAEFHVELISRIATQPLGYLDGVEVTALESIVSLFQSARAICNRNPAAVGFSAVVWEVLNKHVRPFTARWHPVGKRGHLVALDMTDEFRSELELLQSRLRRMASLLAVVAGGFPPSANELGHDARTDSIITEMSSEFESGIPLMHGGVNPDVAAAINVAEQTAIRDRRKHYSLSNTEKKHTVALALSGGGIRSATFSLGVLVAMARRGILPQFDYLSSVSGGGYLGSFVTCLLNSPGANRRPLGLRSTEEPFDSSGGESLPIRHLRHFSKYLAVGSFCDRVSMAAAQVYGMILNGLCASSVALFFAICERALREQVSWPYEWSTLFLMACGGAVVFGVVALLVSRSGRRAQKIADWTMAVVFFILFALALWRGLAACHAWAGRYDLWRWLPNAGLLCVAGTALLVITSAAATVWGRAQGRMYRLLELLSIGATPLFVLGVYLLLFEALHHVAWWPAIVGVVVLGAVNTWVLNVNVTSPHRLYRNKLADAYLVQYPNSPNPNGELSKGVNLKLSQSSSARAPYQLINAALNVPGSKDPHMRGRLTDFFLFSRDYCGSPLTGYAPTSTWEASDPHLDLGTAMAISGAAAAPQMGLGTRRRLSFWLALLNVRLGYWLRNPLAKKPRLRATPGIFNLLCEMTGAIKGKGSRLYLSDGGHIENLGVYELLRRRCKYIVAVDGEQDSRMTFAALTNLQRLAAIDLGVKLDIDLDDLRLNNDGMSRSHFRFCRIEYPREQYGYLLYVKLSLTGNEGEFLRRYRLDEPVFPHHPTADQFFTEAQFEAYRSLGEHIGDRLFLRTLVGELSSSKQVEVEKWFKELGRRLLRPISQ